MSDDQPRDWDKELAKIDRVIARGDVPAPASAPRQVPGPSPATPAVRRRSVALTWFWTVLAGALALALVIWPYDRACGLRLIFYLGATSITILVGFLAALASWSHRRGFAHILALAVITWAAIAAAREVLPRIGYARHSLTWGCPSQAAPPPAAQPQAAPPPAAQP